MVRGRRGGEESDPPTPLCGLRRVGLLFLGALGSKWGLLRGQGGV